MALATLVVAFQVDEAHQIQKDPSNTAHEATVITPAKKLEGCIQYIQQLSGFKGLPEISLPSKCRIIRRGKLLFRQIYF